MDKVFKTPSILSTMDAKQELVAYQKKVDGALSRFFQDKIAEAGRVDPSTVDAIAQLENFTMRKAKRLRPAFMYYGYACFADPNDDVVYASMAMEMIQSYLLIHDDIMDQDVLRRGKETVHVHYGKKYGSRHGESVAICVGDFAVHYANEILAESNFPADRKLRAIVEMNKYVRKVVHGQIRDLRSSVLPQTEDDVMKTYLLKSATYTIEGPLHIGAILAGADDADLETLSQYALPLGVAFQLRDDINGLFGDPAKTGKPADSDLKEGKYTMLTVYALAHADPLEQKVLRSALGNAESTADEINQVREIIRNVSLAYMTGFAEGKVKRAIAAIDTMPYADQGKSFLIGIAEFIAVRDH